MDLTEGQKHEMVWHYDPAVKQSTKLTATDQLEADYRNWLDAACSHPTKQVYRVLSRSGAEMFRHECMTCGKPDGQWVKRQSVENADVAEMSSRDRNEKYVTSRRNAWAEKQRIHLQRQDEEGNLAYTTHLSSPKWKVKRAKVLDRAGGIYEGSRDQPATQVHHLTYRHVENEFLWELVAICDDCHHRYHAD